VEIHIGELALEILRKLRWVLYPSVFIVVFLMGSYCSFPTTVLRSMAETTLTQAALGIAPPTRGFPKVSIKDISLWRLSGAELKNVRIVWPGTKKEPPMSIDIDNLKGRMGLMGLLTGSKNVSAYGKLYAGSLSTEIKTNKQKSLTNLDIRASKLDLSKIDFIQSLIGAPLQGMLNLVVDLKANSQLSKDGTGTINLTLDQGIFGPGNVKLPRGTVVPSITVPQISLGTLKTDLTLDKGQLESKTFTLSGGDLEADMQFTITLGRIPQLSRLNGRGWFSLKKEFINSNETIKMLFDLIPELRLAKNGDGKVGFVLGGTLGLPMPRLDPSAVGAESVKKTPDSPAN